MYVIVAGAGVIGQEITKQLVKNKHDVVVIDNNAQVCEAIYAETGALTLHGSATDIQILKNAGAEKADVLICLMGQPADNIACSLIARSLGIEQIIARNRVPAYEEAFIQAGVTCIVRMTDLLVNELMMEVEQPAVRKISTIGEGKAEVYSILIPEKAGCIGLSISQIAQNKKFPTESVFMGIYRDNDEFLIPRGNHVIRANDIIFLVSTGRHINQAAEFLTR
ncbi:TrkA family potassium uptake protein [bacterium]|nr:TrkA family potassium uptake protein [bacterium]